MANATQWGEFLLDNLLIATNVLEAARQAGVKKLLFTGVFLFLFPLSPQPLREDSLLTEPQEETNRSYAIAKIAGIELYDAYRHQYDCDSIFAMPTNLYGLNDNYDLATSHVLPALPHKFHEAKREGLPQVELWRTGNPRR